VIKENKLITKLSSMFWLNKNKEMENGEDNAKRT
jgi:hypothetical protein